METSALRVDRAQRARRVLRAFAWSFAAWTVFAGLMMAMSAAGILEMRARGHKVVLWPFVAYNLVYYYEWALLTPGLVYLGLRFPMDRRNWARRVPLHLLLTLATAGSPPA